jgi:FKBP-type peptidyl-prolyl cis-trans isomerase SlyD
MKIASNAVVTMNYTLTDEKGIVLDTSSEAGPLAYIQGIGQIIPGLEKALDGKEKGEKLQVTIAPEDGYGQRSDEMTQTVPKTEFQDAEQIQVGMQFEVETEDAGKMLLTVIEVNDTEVTLDGNHPLAGVTLNFDVEIMDVREATKEELEHGHVHGPGGHQH